MPAKPRPQAESEPEVPAPAAEPEPVLADAASSTDPTVHYLIARRYALAMHDQDADLAIEDLERQRRARAVEHDAITAQLAELGVR